MNMCAWLEMIIRNGMVGDWTLRDGKFMESFRLPRPGEKLDDLQRESRMPGERCIRFDVCSAELRRRSVTAFDSRACIEHSRMAMCGGTTTYRMGALPGGARATHLVSSPSGSPSQQPKTHH